MARMKLTGEARATTSDRLTTVLSYGALLLLGYWVYAIFASYLVPLAWSAVLAMVVLVYTARETLDAIATLQNALAVRGQGPNQGLVLSIEEWVRARLPA